MYIATFNGRPPPRLVFVALAITYRRRRPPLYLTLNSSGASCAGGDVCTISSIIGERVYNSSALPSAIQRAAAATTTHYLNYIQSSSFDLSGIV